MEKLKNFYKNKLQGKQRELFKKYIEDAKVGQQVAQQSADTEKLFTRSLPVCQRFRILTLHQDLLRLSDYGATILSGFTFIP